tara:strand:- start:123 stop:344 length:222 start_codon:yes stop_codon:yes gene_type:complete
LSINRIGIDNIPIRIGEYLTIFGGIRRRIEVKLYQELASKDCNLKISRLIPIARHLPTNHDHNKAEIAKKIRI